MVFGMVVLWIMDGSSHGSSHGSSGFQKCPGSWILRTEKGTVNLTGYHWIICCSQAGFLESVLAEPRKTALQGSRTEHGRIPKGPVWFGKSGPDLSKLCSFPALPCPPICYVENSGAIN